MQRYAPIGAAVGVVLFAELILTVGGWKFLPDPTLHLGAPTPAVLSNTGALGRLIYTNYVFLFQASGLILLVAMIGAIVLTHRERNGASLRQNITRQQDRQVRDTLQVMKVSLGAGTAQTGIMRRLPPPSRGGGTRARPEARTRPSRGTLSMAVGIGHYLVVGAMLLVLGIFGIFLNRKNIIVIMMSIELILLAVNINLVAFSGSLGDLAGQVFAMFVLTVAAAEAAIGLAIVVVYFRNRGSIQVEDVTMMKG